MALATVNDLIAGFQAPRRFEKSLTGTMVIGRAHSLWGINGIPSAGEYDTTLDGVTLTSPVAGQLPFDNAASGDARLSKFLALSAVGGRLELCDRIWHNGGMSITSTSLQSITSPTFPARDRNGATAGVGLNVGVEISSAVGAGTPTLTVGYTNSSGTTGRTGTNIFATAASSIAGTFHKIGYASGDEGIEAIESFQQSATRTSGTQNLVVYRPVVSLGVVGNVPVELDVLTGGLALMHPDSVPFLIFTPAATTSVAISAEIGFVHG
jgi:hypothetical protein